VLLAGKNTRNRDYCGYCHYCLLPSRLALPVHHSPILHSHRYPHQVTTVLSTVINADMEGNGGTTTALFAQCQPFVLPVLNTILSPTGDYLEYLESGLEILTFMTYYVKPEGELRCISETIFYCADEHKLCCCDHGLFFVELFSNWIVDPRYSFSVFPYFVVLLTSSFPSPPPSSSPPQELAPRPVKCNRQPKQQPQQRWHLTWPSFLPLCIPSTTGARSFDTLRKEEDNDDHDGS